MLPDNNWLEPVSGTMTVSGNGISNYWIYPNTGYPYYNYTNYPSYITHTTPARPIKLNLTEVDTLRKVCKNNSHLKEILKKFTDHIEILVDLE